MTSLVPEPSKPKASTALANWQPAGAAGRSAEHSITVKTPATFSKWDALFAGSLILFTAYVLLHGKSAENMWLSLVLLWFFNAPAILLKTSWLGGLQFTFDRQGFKTRHKAVPFFTKTRQRKNLERAWTDLECVRFQKREGLSVGPSSLFGAQDCLVFDWRAGANVRKYSQEDTSYLPVSNLSTVERDQLFTALAQFVPQELLAPEVLYLQVKTLSGEESARAADYTQLWLDQYTRNFEMSNYIPLVPGATCGNNRFTINMIIAARINSSTYLATTGSGTKVVIKELLAPVGADDGLQSKMLEQFNREAGILATLDHPNIIKILDHFIEKDRSYIVMALASGKNMREIIRHEGVFKRSQVIKSAMQMASVLHYLHHHSPPILHRDFTPDNLMYGNDDHVTVVDFGAANVYNTGKTATLIGKQNYMPAEQIQGKPSPASDIYALGATLAFLLTGQDLPSLGKLPVLDHAKHGDDLVMLIKNCTAFEAGERPDCDQVLAQLRSMEPSTLGRG